MRHTGLSMLKLARTGDEYDLRFRMYLVFDVEVDLGEIYT